MKVVCIHTIESLASLFESLFEKQVIVSHIIDSNIVSQLVKDNGFTTASEKKLRAHLENAVKEKPDAILVTCSSLSKKVIDIRQDYDIQIFTIDEPMILHALKLGKKITVVATAVSTLESTKTSITNTAKKLGTKLALEVHLVKDALTLLHQGNLLAHDQLILEYINNLQNIETLILAQASMAHIEDKLKGDYTVLSSPKLAVREVMNYLKG